VQACQERDYWHRAADGFSALAERQQIGRKHLVGLTVRELRTWQEMRQEPLTEGVWMVVDRKWVKKNEQGN
jgi:hypothetical protein